eukprot:1185142-Prorocentrum_minimum.AAC.3
MVNVSHTSWRMEITKRQMSNVKSQMHFLDDARPPPTDPLGDAPLAALGSSDRLAITASRSR